MTTGATPYRIDFDGRTVYDFLISLSVSDLDEHDVLPDDRRWLVDAKAALSKGRQADLEACFGDSPKAMCEAVGALAVLLPGARTARQFVGALAALDTRSAMRALLGEMSREAQAADQLERILDGAADEIAPFAARSGESHHEGIAELLASPDAWLDRIRGLLGEWVGHFEKVEPRIERMIRRDLESRTGDAAGLPPEEVIERATRGVRWFGEAGIERVVLSPSYFARPYNYLYAGRDWRLFAYPLADAALELGDETAPPQAIIRLHRALGDESRLRILRLLRDRDMYMTELAQHLEVSKPTMTHHLALLRAAGLVTVTAEGSMTYYSLRRDRLEQADDDIRRYLA